MLNIKYSKQKLVDRDDPVLDSLLKTKDFYTKNSNSIVGAVVVVIFLIGVLVAFNYFKKSNYQKAQETFGTAMIALDAKDFDDAINQFRIVAENHGNATQGTMSACMLGSIFYNQGRFDDAIQWFTTAAQSRAKVGFVSAEAYEGLAACYDAKGDSPSAIDQLNKALAEERISYRHTPIKWKLALLNSSTNSSLAVKLCNEIIADTSSIEYHSNAEYLKASLNPETGK